MLTDGGYTHHREKTATQLGDVAKWLRDEDDGDMNNLLKAAHGQFKISTQTVRDVVRIRLREVKGLGNVALDVFCDSAQGLWPELAPFLDPRRAYRQPVE